MVLPAHRPTSCVCFRWVRLASGLRHNSKRMISSFAEGNVNVVTCFLHPRFFRSTIPANVLVPSGC